MSSWSRGGQISSLSSPSACILAISPAQDAATPVAWQQAGKAQLTVSEKVRRERIPGQTVRSSDWHFHVVYTGNLHQLAVWPFAFSFVPTHSNPKQLFWYGALLSIYEFPTHCWNHNAHNKYTQPPQVPAAQPARWYMNTLRPSLKKPSA